MAEVAVNVKNKRHIWLAIMFSLIMPGLGQVYCGKLARGLVLNFLNILPLPLIIGLFLISNSPALMLITIALILAAGIVQLVAIIDSAYIAKHTKTDYELKDYNRWYVYVLFVLIITGGSIGSALYLREQTLEAFRVTAASCYPTIVPNDRILANKSAYKTKDPQRGDLIVHICPFNRHWNYIKRIVAVAGDTVEIKDGQLYVNDEKLQRQMLPQSMLDDIRVKVEGELLEGDVFEEVNGDAKYKIFLARPPHGKTSVDFAKITVPKHHCFVLGDNRNNSQDSRHFGPLPLATVKGRADYLYFPAKDWSRFGRIKN
jgi:signal peptidase I